MPSRTQVQGVFTIREFIQVLQDVLDLTGDLSDTTLVEVQMDGNRFDFITITHQPSDDGEVLALMI